MRGVHDSRRDRRPRRGVPCMAVGGAWLGQRVPCRVPIVAFVVVGATVVAPPVARGVGLVGGGSGAGPAHGGRCALVRAARRRFGRGARRCWALRPSTAGSRRRANTGCCSHGGRGIVIRTAFCPAAVQQNPVSLGRMRYVSRVREQCVVGSASARAPHADERRCGRSDR
jgi:hypothetical protein